MVDGEVMPDAVPNQGRRNISDDLGGGFQKLHVGVGDGVAVGATGVDVEVHFLKELSVVDPFIKLRELVGTHEEREGAVDRWLVGQVAGL